tara:strand:+ start:5221 stop:6366 length:1146 start_codon:yes stop_codon:yes gene_type:complete
MPIFQMNTYLKRIESIVDLSDAEKIKWLRILAILGFISVSIYAPQLWINTKEFPVIPLIEGIYIANAPFDTYIAYLFFGLLISQLFFQRKAIGLLIIGMYIYLCFVDQNRLQPYLYQSIITLLFIYIFPKEGRERTIVFAISLLFFATYFWSGIHKLNEIFYTQWMHALSKHFSFIPKQLLLIFTYAVPYVEALLGIGLFIDKIRKATILFIVGMHIIIIGLLFYLGYGYNVVPWNLQNILSVFVLFWCYQTRNTAQTFFFNFNYKKGIVIIFTFLLPFSNLFGIWDHLLSFSYFTSKLNYYYIEINDDELKENLPEHIKQFYRTVNDRTVIYPNEWAGEVNMVLFYPQDRCIHYLDRYLKDFSDKENKDNLTKLVIYNKD